MIKRQFLTKNMVVLFLEAYHLGIGNLPSHRSGNSERNGDHKTTLRRCSFKKYPTDSTTAGTHREETVGRKITGSTGVRSVYLSLTTHLIIAIILTLWAISPENQSNRLAPVIIDFGTEVEKEWGETNGDNKAATVLTEADKKMIPMKCQWTDLI